MLLEVSKTCWLCRHMVFIHASPDYSELTPGSNATIECGKHYWDLDLFNDSQAEAAAKFAHAETCPDYVSVRPT